MHDKKIEQQLLSIFDRNYIEDPAADTQFVRRIYDRIKIGKEILALGTMDLKEKYEKQVEDLAIRFIRTIQAAEARIPNIDVEQEIRVIITSPDNELEVQLAELIKEGYFIQTALQDIHSKGGREAMYVVICHKK